MWHRRRGGQALGARGDVARAHEARVVDVVGRISAALRHRGPDGSGLWASSGREVVFAHRRLAILDLSEAGAQPMVDGESGCVITFNGEIYNFLELRRELEALGESFRSSSDTEVILKAYKRWGIDAVRRFRGIFALALWDPAVPLGPPGARPDGHQAPLLDHRPGRRTPARRSSCSRRRCVPCSRAAPSRAGSIPPPSRPTCSTDSWSAPPPSSRAFTCCRPRAS